LLNKNSSASIEHKKAPFLPLASKREDGGEARGMMILGAEGGDIKIT